MTKPLEALIAKIKKQTENFDTVILNEDEAISLMTALEQPRQEKENLSKSDISAQLHDLITATHGFACSLDIGDERTEAFEVYEVLRRLQRRGSASEMLNATNPLLCTAIADDSSEEDEDD